LFSLANLIGLFIVAPITRAVDDKAAKSLLGESFKLQLKFDGIYSRITFICSKTDDISITEAADSLGLEERVETQWEMVDAIEERQRWLRQNLGKVVESKSVYTERIGMFDDEIEEWDKLKCLFEHGKVVYNPSDSKKRQGSWSGPMHKRQKMLTLDFDNETDEVNDNYEDHYFETNSRAETASQEGNPLTSDEIDVKLRELRDHKRWVRQERNKIDNTITVIDTELVTLDKRISDIGEEMRAICIEGRNEYSKSAIQRDFSDGIREYVIVHYPCLSDLLL
jgi:hypothetical protein